MAKSPAADGTDQSQLERLIASDIEQTLEIIFLSEEFGRSGRLVDLLRFIVGEEMAGRGGRLKAYTIATQVLGRNANFDAAQDSIVRVEIARLRTALKLFYFRGVETPVLIDIPKGAYRPVISGSPGAMKEAPPQQADIPRGNRGKANSKHTIRLSGTWMFAIPVATLVLAGGTALFLRPGPVQPPAALPPLVLVSPITISSSDPAMKTFELGLQGELLAELSRHHWMSVAYRSDGHAVPNPAEPRSIYTVSINFVVEGRHYSSVTSLSDFVTGRVRSTYVDQGMLPDRQVFPLLATSARRIAADIGQPLGAVTLAELEDGPNVSRGPYSCLLNLRRYLLSWLATDREVFRACALAEPRQPDALSLGLAAYAYLEEARYRGGDSRTTLIAAATRDVETAMAMRPKLYLLSGIAARAAACRGDFAQVEVIFGNIRRNAPNDPAALSRIANVRAYVLGDLASGMILARKARELSLILQPDDSTVPALDSLMRGEWEAAVTFVSGPPRSTNPLALIVLLAAHGELGNKAGSQATAAVMAEAGFPDAESVRTYLANECLADAVRERLRQGVAKALAYS
jgi:adenylate cyclase